MSTPIPVALTIAGFDPSSGAGVSADLAVFAAFGVFGTAAISSQTVQSTVGVAGREDTSAAHLSRTLEHLTCDLPPDGIKIGMLGTPKAAKTVAEFLKARKNIVPVVWDPVLVSTSGAALFDVSAFSSLHDSLLPAVGWATPNWAELSALTGQEVATEEDSQRAARALGERHPKLWLVVTGGDQEEAIDLLRAPSGEIRRFAGPKIVSKATHGTGCAFSSALLAGLILGQSPEDAVAKAKSYVAEAIRCAPGLGSGQGPMDLYWPLRKGNGQT